MVEQDLCLAGNPDAGAELAADRLHRHAGLGGLRLLRRTRLRPLRLEGPQAVPEGEILCPSSLSAAGAGLALLLWFNALGINPSWQTAVVAHLVWIVPVVTLVIAIQVYSLDPTLEEAARDLGASRWFILREITLPILWPGIWSGALFAFLLSWGNFPLSLYTAGVDSTIPKWLYSKMVAGYSPMVPALGTMSTLSAAALLLAGGLVIMLVRRRQAEA
jgi:spermidine/putrescine transport system permease protein